MQVSEIFRKDIARRIEEVIKVDFDEEAAVARELDEYVVTENLRDSIEDILERLDYSRDLNLAELEFELEGDGVLGDFEQAFNEVSGDRGDWRTRRNIG